MAAENDEKKEAAAQPVVTPATAAAPERPYSVLVSTRFLVLGLLSSMLLAFSVGRAARIILLKGPTRALLAPHDQSTLRNRPDYHEGYNRLDASLPPPISKKGRPVPHTVYTSKNFDTARTATSSSLLIRRNEEDGDEGEEESQVCLEREDGTKQCTRGRIVDAYEEPQADEGDEEEEEEHLPAGQHLLVDIKNVEGAFLNSEERLAHAMVEVVNEAALTLLSYHCHKMVPAGVSCVGVLLESHVSFHTWPAEGVITLDLFTCGSKPLLPVVPIIERLFCVPRHPSTDGPVVRWSHKLRGFRPPQVGNPLQQWDLGVHVLGDLDLDMKEEIVSVQTEYQRIDILDVIFPRFNRLSAYERSLSNDGSYESQHPELYLPDRLVFLDGVLQSRRQGEAAYHEALVHPAMFAHSKPERVAIIGGGEGATLREVLKHNTVKEAIMIEIDEVMVKVSKEFLPDWSDCSDLVGSASWCGDDPRSRMFYEDALGWFMNRFGEDGTEEKKIDVIVMDALDPESDIPFTKALYNNDAFLKSLFKSLSDDGIIVMQLGEAPGIDDPDEMLSRSKNRAIITNLLAKAGFESIHVYEESHSGFFFPWSYVVAFKEYETRTRWYANEAEVELAIQKRAVRTKSGSAVFRYFDGATMVSYQLPSRAWEIVFCRQQPAPYHCLPGVVDFDPDTPSVPLSSFVAKTSTAGENAGRGLFATVDIPKHSYLSPKESAHPVWFPASTFRIMMETLKHPAGEYLESFDYYANGYGFHSSAQGGQEVYVDSGLHTFANHGCNRTYNMGTPTEVTEFTADLDKPRKELLGRSHACSGTLFNPAIDRHLRFLSSGADYSLRDIAAGEEILDNYLWFIGTFKYWKDDLVDLRALCSGEAGEVLEYEQLEQSQTEEDDASKTG